MPSNLPMTWVIDFVESIGIVRATVSGKMTADGIKTMTVEVLEESKRRDIYRCLCDCREVSLGINIAEVYALPKELRAQGVMSYHMFALLYTDGPVTTPLFSFFGERCHAVGLSQKTFSDYDQASLWLTGIDWTISNPTCEAL